VKRLFGVFKPVKFLRRQAKKHLLRTATIAAAFIWLISALVYTFVLPPRSFYRPYAQFEPTFLDQANLVANKIEDELKALFSYKEAVAVFLPLALEELGNDVASELALIDWDDSVKATSDSVHVQFDSQGFGIDSKLLAFRVDIRIVFMKKGNREYGFYLNEVIGFSIPEDGIYKDKFFYIFDIWELTENSKSTSGVMIYGPPRIVPMPLTHIFIMRTAGLHNYTPSLLELGTYSSFSRVNKAAIVDIPTAQIMEGLLFEKQGFNKGGVKDFWNMLYFSVTVLFTATFGDFVPITPFARLLVAAQIFVSLILITMLLDAVNDRLPKQEEN
jgi:hypothetical protein